MLLLPFSSPIHFVVVITIYHDLTFFDNFFLLIIMYKNIENTKIAKLIIWDVEKGHIPPLS